MILGGLIIVIFYFLGELTQHQLALPIPGSVIGMLYMLIYLMWRKEAAACLKKASHTLISHLTLLLIPSCVGVITCIDILKQQGLLIAVSIVLALLISVVITGWFLKTHKQRIDSIPEQYADRKSLDRS